MKCIYLLIRSTKRCTYSSNVDTIDDDFATDWLYYAEHGLDESGFATSTPAYHANLLAALESAGYSMKYHRCVRVVSDLHQWEGNILGHSTTLSYVLD